MKSRLLILSLVVWADVSLTCVARAGEPSVAEFDRRAQAGERLNVVFFGASLTWGANATDPQLTSYRARIAQRLEQRYPHSHFRCWDAAIGGTNSQLGVFRLERDVLARKPDLVFLDFTANDGLFGADEETLSSYESLVRRIIGDGKAPVVAVLFPFKGDVSRGNLQGMARRDAHRLIAAAYHVPLGDAIELAQERVQAKQVTIDELWPVDGVHPGDRGYELFADAAWDAFLAAARDGRTCTLPEKMLHSDTYMTAQRVRISSLGNLPEGWVVSRPHVVSAYFDMLMSRWLDDEVVVKSGPKVKPLELKVQAKMILAFGESTKISGKYRVWIDGKMVEKKNADKQLAPAEFDCGRLGKIMGNNAHYYDVLATDLDPGVEHDVRIEPLFSAGADQELRLESICVAGGKASVRLASPDK